MLAKRTLLQTVSVQVGEVCTEEPPVIVPDDEDEGVPTPGGGGAMDDPCAVVFNEWEWVVIDGQNYLMSVPSNPDCEGTSVITGPYA